MDEQKVRDAVKVANEMAATVREDCFMSVWHDVFAALIAEPYPYASNLTTAALAEKQTETNERP